MKLWLMIVLLLGGNLALFMWNDQYGWLRAGDDSVPSWAQWRSAVVPEPPPQQLAKAAIATSPASAQPAATPKVVVPSTPRPAYTRTLPAPASPPPMARDGLYAPEPPPVERVQAVAAQAPSPVRIQAPPVVTTAPPPAIDKAPLCMRQGPLRSRAQAVATSSRWKALGASTRISSQRGRQQPKGSWVFYRIADQASGSALTAEIRKAGIGDTAIMRSRTHGLIVSAGLFSTHEGLDDRLRRLKGVSRKPEVVSRGKAALSFTVFGRLDGDTYRQLPPAATQIKCRS